MDITDTAGTNPCSSTQNSAQESTLADWTDSVRKTQRAWKDIWGVQERFLRWRDKMSGQGAPSAFCPSHTPWPEHTREALEGLAGQRPLQSGFFS